MTCLKLHLESANKKKKQKRHCFVKSYGFHSLQEVLKVIGNLCSSLWVTYFTRIPCQTRRINWSEINSYFTRCRTRHRGGLKKIKFYHGKNGFLASYSLMVNGLV